MHSTTSLRVRDLHDLVGQRGTPRPAKFPVNEAMIGLWCDAVGDSNPAYLDSAWAATSRWHGLIAPATSLNMWTLPGYRRIHPEGEPLDAVTQVLNAEGYTSVAAVDNNHTYHRPLRPGDQLHQVQYLAAFSGPKQTSLGEGYFFDIVSEFITQDGESVGQAMMRIFKWAPGTGEPTAPDGTDTGASAEAPEEGPTSVAVPAREPRETIAATSVRVGQALPAWSMPLTATRIIALAAATLDYNDVHFERDAAVRAGARDIYMNILGSSGLMNRYLTDWAGPEAGLKAIDVKLRGQNHPGDTVAFSGRITDIEPTPDNESGATSIKVAVRAVNARGPHLEAAVTLDLPS